MEASPACIYDGMAPPSALAKPTGYSSACSLIRHGRMTFRVTPLHDTDLPVRGVASRVLLRRDTGARQR
jgi:hypothetical protein